MIMVIDNFNINTDVCYKHGVTLDNFIVLCLANNNACIEYEQGVLVMNGYLKKNSDNKFSITNKGKKLIKSIIEKSKIENDIDAERIVKLAFLLKEMFPKGMKPNTDCFWRGTQKTVCESLAMLLSTNKVSDADIISATNKYLQLYMDDTLYMKTLPYFIWQDGKSKLLEFIENKETNESENYCDASSCDS